MDYAAYLAENIPFLLPLGTLALAVAAWAVRYPKLALVFLFASLLAGQAIRLPVPGQPAGLLPSDLAVILVLLSALGLLLKERRLRVTGYSLRVTPFIAWSAFSLVINLPRLGSEAALISFAYWLRLTAHLLLLPALLVLFRDESNRKLAHKLLVVTAVILALAGFAQMIFLPDLSALKQGWDPHPGRLVSTWLDPNFLAAAFVIMLLHFTANWLFHALPPLQIPFQKSSLRGARLVARRGNLVFIAVLLAALLLTKSRSAFLSLAATALTFSPLLAIYASKKSPAIRHVVLINVASAALIAAALAVFVLGERASGLITYDDTVRLRAQGYMEAWRLARENILVGVGYNAYQFAAREAGAIDDFSIHSRAGSDSSLLTLVVTTGLPGAALYLFYWLSLARKLLSNWIKQLNPSSLAACAAIVFLLINSLFINSFLYSHLLIIISMVVAFGSINVQTKNT